MFPDFGEDTMKTFGLGLLVTLLFSTTCLAQVETQRFLTPERTAWKVKNLQGFSVYFPISFDHIGFFDGDVWLCDSGTCSAFVNSFYVNRLISNYDASICIPNPSPYTTACFTMSGYTIPFLRRGKVKYCLQLDDFEECFESALIRDNNNFTYTP